MDSISRKAAIETVKKLLYETAFNSCGHHQDDEIYADIAEHRIEVWLGLVPSVPAVPLDKLCEWLERYAMMDCDGCREAFGSCEDEENQEVSVCNSRERWKAMLTKWMEGLDAAD